MIVPLSGRQTECCSCRRKACFYNWMKSTQMKEFCSLSLICRWTNIVIYFQSVLQTDVCFLLRIVRPIFCWMMQACGGENSSSAVLWSYESLINVWHVLQTRFTSVYSRKFIIGNLHTHHNANTCFITATHFRLFWKVSNVFNTRNVITFQQLCCSWYKNEFCLLLANSMESSHCWEANQFSASQEIPHLFWNPKFPYRIRKCRQLSLSWARSIQSVPPTFHFLKFHLNTINLLSTPVASKWSLSRKFPLQNPVWTSHLPHKCYMPPSSWYVHPCVSSTYH